MSGRVRLTGSQGQAVKGGREGGRWAGEGVRGEPSSPSPEALEVLALSPSPEFFEVVKA